MQELKSFTAVVAIASLLTGCAASPKQFINKSGEFSDTRVCRNYLKDYTEANAVNALGNSEEIAEKQNETTLVDVDAPCTFSDAEVPLKTNEVVQECIEPENETASSDELQGLYLAKLLDEVNTRGLTLQTCQQLVKEEDNRIAAGIIIGAAVATAIVVGTSGDGGGGGGAYDGYAWDGFRDQYGNIVWRCRDKTNGQFAYDFNCGGMAKVDNTWPSW